MPYIDCTQIWHFSPNWKNLLDFLLGEREAFSGESDQTERRPQLFTIPYVKAIAKKLCRVAIQSHTCTPGRRHPAICICGVSDAAS